MDLHLDDEQPELLSARIRALREIRALLKPYPERPPAPPPQKPYEPPSRGRYKARRGMETLHRPADDARQRGDRQKSA